MLRNIWRTGLLRPGLDSLRKAKPNEFNYSSVAGKLELPQILPPFNAEFSLKEREESTVRSSVRSIVNALHLGDKSAASNLLHVLTGDNSKLKAQDFECILELCSKNHDPLFAIETWRVLQDKQINANEACYMFSIRSLCKGGYFKEAFDILRVAGENRELMLLPIYNDFLNSCLEFQNLQYANQCLDMMEKQAVGKNEITYIVLLKLSVLQNNLSAVRGIWEEYIKHYNPTILSLRRFIWAFASLKDFEYSLKMLQHMVTLAVENIIHVKLSNTGKMSSPRPDIPIPSRIELHWHSCLVENHESSNSSLIESCSVDSNACSTFSISRGKHNRMIRNIHAEAILKSSFAEVVFACVHGQNSKLAEELLHQMENLGLTPSKTIYDAFIKAVSSGGGYECGLEVLKEMQKRRMEPCESSLASLSISCSKALKLNLAEELLDKVSARAGVLPFNVFLAACDALGRPEVALRMLSRMKKRNVQLDKRTYELLFSLFGNLNTLHEEMDMISRENAFRRIRAIELDMARNGLKHSYTSMRNLLSALGAEGLKREPIQYLLGAEKLVDTSDSRRMATLHNIVLQSLVEFKETSAAVNIFKNMRKQGFLPNTATYSIMIECCSLDGCYRSALQLLSLMLRDGYFPNTVTYTSLMKVVKDYENFFEELYLLERASTEECDLEESSGDAVMYNTVLLKARDKGRIDIIEFLVEKMHQDKIQPNPVTCSIVLDAYTNGGYINTALEALQVLSLRMISKDKDELQKQQPELEDLILSQSPEAESQILEHFNSDSNFATALLNLRWCSLIGFSTPWSPDETSWSKTLSANFRRALSA